MLNKLQLLDTVIFDVIKGSEKKLEDTLDSDVMYYYGEIRVEVIQHFRNFIEKLAEREERKKRISILLTTPGGSAEAVEKMVEIIRHHYDEVYFIVPDMAMSAGTIFCMSGDKIYMDYSSSLGPIDPQVPDKENQFLVPALGYLDKIQELIEKSRTNTITPAEFQLLAKQDLAMLRLYEQAKDLSKALLKSWLVQYKFKDWLQHRTNNVGTTVTMQEKEKRAEDIAEKLSNNKEWHSHGRMIGMKTLRDKLCLIIDDLSLDRKLHSAVRNYSDTLTDYLSRNRIQFFLYSSYIN